MYMYSNQFNLSKYFAVLTSRVYGDRVSDYRGSDRRCMASNISLVKVESELGKGRITV